MKQTLITFSLIMMSLNSFCQNYIYVGDNRYKSTESWEFALNSSTWSGTLNVQVAKTDWGGYLWLSTEMNAVSDDYIGGDIVIYLEDGSSIKCVDRNIRDKVDDNAITLYKFTKSEIETLKTKRIHTIRLKIYQPHFGSKNVTADNKSRFSFNSDNPIGKYKTEESISLLFN